MITIPLIVCLVGLVLYFAFDNKVSESGRIMFAFGLLAVLLSKGVALF